MQALDKTIRHPAPPFTAATAADKVQKAEDGWNSQDPIAVSMAYSEDSQWRNRSEFINGRPAIQKFLANKWQQELDYKLKKELWSYTDDRIAVTFFYEWRNPQGQWFRSHGNELWEFNRQGYMTRRIASINDQEIEPPERLL